MTKTGPSVLIVAAESSQRNLIAGLLRDAGFRVETAAHASASPSGVGARSFDLIVAAAPYREARNMVAAARRHDPALRALFIIEPGEVPIAEFEHSSIVTEPAEPRFILGAAFELLLRDPERKRQGLWEDAAQDGIAAAELRCLHHRHAAAHQAGAADLIDDLAGRIARFPEVRQGRFRGAAALA